MSQILTSYVTQIDKCSTLSAHNDTETEEMHVPIKKARSNPHKRMRNNEKEE